MMMMMLMCCWRCLPDNGHPCSHSAACSDRMLMILLLPLVMMLERLHPLHADVVFSPLQSSDHCHHRRRCRCHRCLFVIVVVVGRLVLVGGQLVSSQGNPEQLFHAQTLRIHLANAAWLLVRSTHDMKEVRFPTTCSPIIPFLELFPAYDETFCTPFS